MTPWSEKAKSSPCALEERHAGGKQWFIARILVGRFLVLGGVLLAVTSMRPVGIPGFHVFAAVALLSFIPYSLWLRRHPWLVQAVSLQFVLDVVVTTGLIHFSGGIVSPFYILYPLIILATGLVSTATMAVEITFLSSLCYSLLVVLQENDIVVTGRPADAALAGDPNLVQGVMVRVFLFVFFGAASSYLAKFTSYQGRRIRCYAKLISAILDHIPVGIFAVSEDGTIGMVNHAATSLLNTPAESLHGNDFAKFIDIEKSEGDVADRPIRTYLSAGARGTTIPVVCVASKTQVPREFLRPGNRHFDFFRKVGSQPETTVRIWAVRDIRSELEAERAGRETTRLQTTVHVASELAHHVRNALTAINSAAQLMRMTVDGSAANDPVTPDDRERVASMSRVIDSETERLEDKLSDVLRRTEEDPSGISGEAAALYARYLQQSEAQKKN